MSFCLTQSLHCAVQHKSAATATRFGGREQTWTRFAERTASFADALALSDAGKVLATKLREPFWQGRQRNEA